VAATGRWEHFGGVRAGGGDGSVQGGDEGVRGRMSNAFISKLADRA